MSTDTVDSPHNGAASPNGAAPKIRAVAVGKTFPSSHGPVEALHNFSLDIYEGEFLSLVGPSGCGKSTFLRILAGLAEESSGQISIHREAKPSRPLSSMVFQEYAVFPWKTVAENVAFGLHMRGVSRSERSAIAADWIDRVGLRKFARHYPHQLSGGMRQRVGIARALANDPEILLMDEPLGALDAQTRTVLQEQLLELWQEGRKTVLYVTHSIEEAVLLGDRVVLMTAHPGTNKAEFDIPLDRPRSLKTTAEPEFARLSYAIWESLRDEVQRSIEEAE
ncbi:MAG: ABC transporter ATP-binding protein [Spirochaetaceae bacterium]|nr:MAG: ABC transporter ATP-binding protein [Spirochaetaceae bacterium]